MKYSFKMKHSWLLAISVCLLAISNNLKAQSGFLDKNYGTGGIAIFDHDEPPFPFGHP